MGMPRLVTFLLHVGNPVKELGGYKPEGKLMLRIGGAGKEGNKRESKPNADQEEIQTTT